MRELEEEDLEEQLNNVTCIERRRKYYGSELSESQYHSISRVQTDH